MAKKMISMLLALAMVLTMLAACNQGEDIVDSNDDRGEDNVSETLDLVVDGVSEYVIVRGENAYISEVTASTELQSYIKQISGVEIPIVTDTAEPTLKEIVVGKTNREADGEFNREELGDDGLVIKTNGQKLFLVGGEQRGTLYAVYEFLEAYLGCRFYTNEIEKVPEMKTISFEKIEEDKQIPVIEYRTIVYNEYDGGIAVKRRYNYYRSISEELGGQAISYLNSGHSMSYFVSAADYFEEHPEYFSMNEKGERVSDKQHCFTNPEVLDIVINEIRARLGDNKDVCGIMQVQQADTDGPCLCDNCKAVYEEEGGAYSGTIIRFVNAVANELKDEYPNVLFETFAYMFSRSAPTKTIPADNVSIMLCSIESCYSHPIDSDCVATKRATYLDGSSKTYIEDLISWGKITENVAIYDYMVNFAHWAMTFPNFEPLQYNVRLYAENNVNQVYPLAKYESLGVEFGELRSYLLSKLLWDPYMSEDEYLAHMDDFIEGVYGPGGRYIKEYIDLAEELSNETCFGIYNSADDVFDWPIIVELNDKRSYPESLTSDMIRNYETVDWSQYWNWFKDYEYTPKIVSEGERLFGEAMALAETDAQRKALDKAYCQVEYIRLCYESNRIDAGTGAIGRIIGYFTQDHPDDFATEDAVEYRRNIIQLANKQIYSVYEEDCKAFVEKVLFYGCKSIREGKTLDLDNMDLTQYPDEWYK